MTPEEIFKRRPPLTSLTNQELLSCLSNIDSVEIRNIAPIVAEILRRMNEQSPLLAEKQQER